MFIARISKSNCFNLVKLTRGHIIGQSSSRQSSSNRSERFNGPRKYFQNQSFVTNAKHFIIAKPQKEVTAKPVDRILGKKAPRIKAHESGTNTEDANLVVTAYTTADDYNLEALSSALKQQGLYEQHDLSEEVHDEVIFVRDKYKVGSHGREVFFFRKGSVVFWNFSAVERNEVLKFLRGHENMSYSSDLIQSEVEEIKYKIETSSKSRLHKGTIILNKSSPDADLTQYTYSNALALSVKLAIWEGQLAKFIDSIEFLTEDMKEGRRFKLSRDQVLRKTGELFALRHNINLSSDLLDVPDFYWDRQELEKQFQNMCRALEINSRTKIMNEKLNHCQSLIDLVSAHLNDKHHIRLEWMIIVLIMVEVVFEIVHYVERFTNDP